LAAADFFVSALSVSFLAAVSSAGATFTPAFLARVTAIAATPAAMPTLAAGPIELMAPEIVSVAVAISPSLFFAGLFLAAGFFAAELVEALAADFVLLGSAAFFTVFVAVFVFDVAIFLFSFSTFATDKI
jgi:hypothetical protein